MSRKFRIKKVLKSLDFIKLRKKKMNPAYIYIKEIDIDQNETFTADFSKKNEIENVVFNKENEYGITGLNINSIVSDSEILKLENEKEPKKISEEMQELIKAYKEPDLTLTASNTETKTIKIPFVKKNESDLPEKKNHISIIQLIKTKIFMYMIMSDI